MPITAFAAPQKDAYRKPGAGMWRALCREQAAAGGAAPDLAASFYVGDAAGRPHDFSDSDRAFAAAVGLRFFEPEQAFAGPAADDAPWAPLAEARAAAAAAAAVAELDGEPDAAAAAAAVPPAAPLAAGDSVADAIEL